MNIEIINVGTELLLGEIVNTNATYLLKMCKDYGFDVYYTTVVGDNPERLKECLDIAFHRGASCVITTGGLGPTQDDLTKEISSEYLGLELIRNEEEVRKVKEKCEFVSHTNHITLNNYKQAYFPESAYILENEVGTANGCVLTNDNKMIINLPGPPKELKYVVEHALKPYLYPLRKERLFTKDYIVMGIGESKVDDILSDLEESQEDATLAMYAGEGKVRVRLAVKDKDDENAYKRMEPLDNEVKLRLKDYIIPDGALLPILHKVIPSVKYKGNIDSPDWLKPYISDNGVIEIKTSLNHVRLGDIITVSFNDTSYDIPLLKDYHLSKERYENWFMLKLYTYLVENKDVW